jgi:predicted Zn-dependent peptidase
MRALLVCSLLAAPLLAQTALPQPTRQTLPNGATVILVRKADVPLISLRAYFRGGNSSEPAELTGISNITAELMRRGTATRNSDQISLELDRLGATLRLGSDRDMTGLSAEFMTRTAEPALAVIEDVLLHPAFPEAEVKKVRAQSIDEARSAKDNPGAAIRLYFEPFFYPAAHPYARSMGGDEAALGRITRPAIEAFYKGQFAGRNLILVAVGDFDPATFGPRLAKLAGAFPAGERSAAPTVAAPKFDSARLLLVDKPDATQTYFRIGMPGIDRRNPDRVALDLINTLFGGRFTSMLNDALRVNAGLTYGANSSVESSRLSGAITLNSYTRTESTVKAIDLALEVLKRLRDKGFDAETLQSGKNYIKGAFPTSNLETSDQLARIFVELEFYGLDRSEYDGYLAKLDSITLDQANAIARKYYVDANLQFCLVGQAAKIGDAVKKYAPKVKLISVKDPGFTAPAF